MDRLDLHRNLPLAALLLASIATAVTGCGESSDGATEVGQTITEALGISVPDDELVESVRVREELLVQQCMLEQGFEYEPADIAAAQFDAPGSEPIEGFGVVAEHEAFALGNGPRNVVPIDEIDPNLAIMTSLSASEMDMYQSALHGQGPESPGCRSTARRVAREEVLDAESSAEQLARIGGPFQEYMRTVSTDPVIAEAPQRFARCLSEAGFTEVANHDEAVAAVQMEIENSGVEAARAFEIELAGEFAKCDAAIQEEVSDFMLDAERKLVRDNPDLFESEG